MKTEEFTKKLTKFLASNVAAYNHRKIRDIYNDNVKYGDIEANKNICVEELSELTKEITKMNRGQGNYFHLLEEMADVKNILVSLQSIYDISDDELDAAQTIKIQRLEEWLKEEKEKASIQNTDMR